MKSENKAFFFGRKPLKKCHPNIKHYYNLHIYITNERIMSIHNFVPGH